MIMICMGMVSFMLNESDPGGPTPTGIQHKSFRIPIGIWNLDEESEIFSKMESSKIDSNSVISPHFHITPHIEAV